VNDWFVKGVDKRSMPTWDTGRKIERYGPFMLTDLDEPSGAGRGRIG
jgi:hypothetical protein